MSYLCSLKLFLLYSSVTLVSGVDRIKLNKCCPNNEIAITSNYVIVNCMKFPDELDYSELYIYEYENNILNELKDVEFNDIFSLSYEDNPETKNKTFINVVNSNLAKDGTMYIEFPNRYYRYIRKPKEEFCVDFFIELADNDVPVNISYDYVDLFLSAKFDNNIEDKGISSVAHYVSVSFFAMVFFVYAVLPELRNLQGLVLMSYVACEIIAFLSLGISRDVAGNMDVCSALTIIIYYFIISGFLWMNVMAFDIWRTFRHAMIIRSVNQSYVRWKFYMYCLYAFGVPLLVTIFFVTVYFMDLSDMPWFVKPNVEGKCFIVDFEKFLYLDIPIIILLSANCLLFIITIYHIWKVQRDTAVLNNMGNRTHHQHKQSFFLYLKLSVVMGINWIFEVLEIIYPEFVLWKYTSYYNGLAGILVFIIFICKKKIFKMLKKRLNDTAIFKDKFTFDRVTKTSISASCDTSLAEDSSDAAAAAISDLPLQVRVCLNPNGRSY